MPRLFVAVWPPPPIVELLAALPRPDEPGVRWTTPDQWHVTVRFLGETDEESAAGALAAVTAPATTATLGPRVSRLGRSVIVVPVAGLDSVAATVRAATADIGEPVDPRPFSGHFTLARLRNGGSCRLAGAALDGSFRVEEVSLVRSELHRDGARYTTVACRPLVNGAVES